MWPNSQEPRAFLETKHMVVPYSVKSPQLSQLICDVQSVSPAPPGHRAGAWKGRTSCWSLTSQAGTAPPRPLHSSPTVTWSSAVSVDSGHAVSGTLPVLSPAVMSRGRDRIRCESLEDFVDFRMPLLLGLPAHLPPPSLKLLKSLPSREYWACGRHMTRSGE